MRYRAVIFDLFGTLADFPLDEFDTLLQSIAGSLSVPRDRFQRYWPATYRDQELGRVESIEAGFGTLVDRAGIERNPFAIHSAASLWRDFQRRILVPREDALSTLERISAAGCSRGIIANTPLDVPPIWHASPFAVFFGAVVFSCHVGMRKPDPRIYALACSALGVTPADCLFVGDGGSSELSGAQRAGLRAVRIRVPYEDAETDRRLGREAWSGCTVTRLSEVVACITCGE